MEDEIEVAVLQSGDTQWMEHLMEGMVEASQTLLLELPAEVGSVRLRVRLFHQSAGRSHEMNLEYIGRRPKN
jgi:hypothetical protein